MNVQSNWWESFFEGVAVDMWLKALPAEHSEREAEFLARTLAVPSGARVARRAVRRRPVVTGAGAAGLPADGR